MSIPESSQNQPRLPIVVEQLRIPEGPDAKLAVCIGFRDDVVNLLKAQNIKIVDSAFRVKSSESIWRKINRRLKWQQSYPVEDQYGVRINMLQEEEIPRGAVAIQSHYNLYHDRLMWGWGDPRI